MFAIMLLILLSSILVLFVSVGLILVDVLRMGPSGLHEGGEQSTKCASLTKGGKCALPTFAASATTCTRMSCKRRVVEIST
jgi:hypothetical protein